MTSYPPQPVDAPLHPDPPWPHLDDLHYWWSCSEPERPGDDHCIYSERCEFCMGKLRVDLANPQVREDVRCHIREGHSLPGHECVIPPDILAILA